MGETFVLVKLIYSEPLLLVSATLILSLSRACVRGRSDQAPKSLVLRLSRPGGAGYSIHGGSRLKEIVAVLSEVPE